MKKILLAFFLLPLFSVVASAQGTPVEQTISRNKQKLSEYPLINSHPAFLEAWKKLAVSWSETRKDLMDWPVAAEKEQIERVDLFYTFLKNNEKDLSGNGWTSNKAGIKATAGAFVNLIVRTEWSVIINREAYSFYPLLEYLQNRY